LVEAKEGLVMDAKREIRFRAFELGEKEMWDHERIDASDKDGVVLWGDLMAGKDKNFSPLMAFTGLLDKAGKPIYEGDILKAPYGLDAAMTTVVVVWDHTLASFEALEPGCPIGDGQLLDLAPSTIYVIGNIHENPELLRESV
jgi:hypothetical protein